MKTRKIIATALEVVLIIVAFAAMSFYTQGKTKPTSVYVYSQNIEDAGTQLGPKLVKEVKVPKSIVNNNFVKSPDEMKGYQTDTKVFAGEFVLKQQLKESGYEDPLQQIDWSANRVITLTAANVSSTVKKGSRVDLIYIGSGDKEKTAEDTDSGNSGSVTYSKVFMQDVVVVSAPGDATVTAPKDPNANAPTEDVSQNAGKVASGSLQVAVTLGQAEEIFSRQSTGQIVIAQRKPGAQKYDTLGYVMGNYKKKFTGHGNAETGSTQIVEDAFNEVKPQS